RELGRGGDVDVERLESDDGEERLAVELEVDCERFGAIDLNRVGDERGADAAEKVAIVGLRIQLGRAAEGIEESGVGSKVDSGAILHARSGREEGAENGAAVAG